MFENRARGLAALTGASQCMVLWGGLWMIYALSKGVCRETVSNGFGAICWAWAAGIVAEIFWMQSRGSIEFSPNLKGCLKRTLHACVFSVIAARGSVLGGMVREQVLALWSVYVVLLVGSYWLFPRLCRRFAFPGHHQHRVMVVGDAVKAESLQNVINQRKSLGFDAVGWLPTVDSIGRSGVDLACAVRDHAADHVILTGIQSETDVVRWKNECEKAGVRLVLAHHLETPEDERFSWESLGHWCFGVACREPLQNPFNRAMKRLMDIGVSSVALLFAVMPVAIATYLAQRKQSPGPLFYKQWRHGRGNRPFMVWKFRTMHSRPGDQSVQASREDPRIYPFGAWLRSHSLDELPQFLNALLGDMSVVGPRPHFVEHTERFESERRYHLRSFVKPGITGLAQVHGCRGEIRTPDDIQKRVRFDVRYVEEWSLWLDVKLIAKTAMQVINPPDTAY